jgi:anti-sigma factor RsiW
MTGLDHEDRVLLLNAALDGELDAAGAIKMERALAADQELATEYGRLEALRKAIRVHAPRENAPASLRARALTAVGDAQTPRRKATTTAWRDPPSWRSFGAAIAATAAVTIGLQNLIASNGAPDAATQAIVFAHMRGQIASQPFDIASSDRHTVKPWLAARLPIAAMVVDLADDGFPLLGGRIDIVEGNPAATLVYKRHEHLISITELRTNIADYPATPKRRALDGYWVIIWSDSERAYAAVSDILPSELDAFVAAFRWAVAKERGNLGAPDHAK